MKNIFKILMIGFTATIALLSCDKVDDLPNYANGTAPVLSSSVTAIAATATDSTAQVVRFSWTDPKYATSLSNTKYIVQIDKAGNNFANASEKEVEGVLDTAYTGKEINEILLANGASFGTAYDMEVRVISSYKNNNDQAISNTVVVKMTPYKIPPKVALPPTDALFIIGGATDGGWSPATVPVPSQQFARVSETVYAGVFNLKANDEFLILLKNGTFDYKFALEDNTVSGVTAGGKFGYFSDTLHTVYNSNFKTPATAGLYRVVLDFQLGMYRIEPFNGQLPTDLVLTGSATTGSDATGWSNPVPSPSQHFTRVNSSVYELTMPLFGGWEYLLLPQDGSWDHKYALNDNTISGIANGGDFGYDLGQNFKSPATNGTYKITLNFAETPLTGTNNNSGRFTVVKQ